MAFCFGGLRSSFLAACLCVALVSSGLAQDSAPGSFRGAQDQGLSLDLDRDFLENLESTRNARTAAEIEAAAKEAEEQQRQEEEEQAVAGAAPGSHRAAQDGQRRVDMSERLSNTWRMNPVLLNRSQGGEPSRPDDDLRDQTIGLEVRREF